MDPNAILSLLTSLWTSLGEAQAAIDRLNGEIEQLRSAAEGPNGAEAKPRERVTATVE